MQNIATKTDETEIRQLVETWVEAARKGNLGEVMACYTPDVLAFDAIGPLQLKGADDYRKHWETCLSYMPPGGEMIMEVHELDVSVSGDLAFAHYVCRCGCVGEDGKEQLGWMRATLCCRKTGEGWRIVHEHYSSPFDPETNKVVDNLAP